MSLERDSQYYPDSQFYSLNLSERLSISDTKYPRLNHTTNLTFPRHSSNDFKQTSWTPVNTNNRLSLNQTYSSGRQNISAPLSDLTTKSASFQQIDQFKQNVLDSSIHSNSARLEFANAQNDFLKDVVGELLDTMKSQTEQLHKLLNDVKTNAETCANNQNCIINKINEIKLSTQSIETHLGLLCAQFKAIEQNMDRTVKEFKADLTHLISQRFDNLKIGILSDTTWKLTDKEFNELRKEVGCVRSKLDLIQIESNETRIRGKHRATLNSSLQKTKRLVRRFNLKKSSGEIYKSVASDSKLVEVKKEKEINEIKVENDLTIVRRRQRPAVLESLVWTQKDRLVNVSSQECLRVSSSSSQNGSDTSCFGFFIGDE